MDRDEVLTVDEARGIMRVGRNQFYKAIQRGEIPGVIRIGKSIRVSRLALERWIQSQVPVA